MDSSSRSMKAVLLHKTNEKPSVLIAYSTDTKETYDKLKLILDSVKYEEHQWRICSDLKVVAILCGLQPGYTKHMCFLCKWDSCSKTNQYQNHSWAEREDDPPLHHFNVIRKPLIENKNNILMPYLHVKLGIVKSCIKTILKDKANPEHARVIFNHLKDKSFKLSDAKIKEGM